MAQKLYEETNIQAIADAIRAKNGLTTTYKTSEMPTAISALSTGGGGGGGVDIPDEAFVISGDCKYWDYGGSWDSFITACIDKWNINELTSATHMFNGSKLETIPFEFNFNGTNYVDCNSMFYNCVNLKETGKIVNMYPTNMSNIFNSCLRLRYLPQFENLNLSRIQTYSNSRCSNMFSYCYSLRSIPENLLKQLYQSKITSIYNSIFYGGFIDCCSLDEIKGLNPQTGTITANMFNNAFKNCFRLKNIIFAAQEDGTPYEVSWKSQVINLATSPVGITSTDSTYNILSYNSGITADKEVKDDATYQALKGNPDWFTCNIAYSRYNHDSAVATINTLPDTSVYLASAGGTNTIKFKGESGSATDGGAISSLTPDEIAVATSRGWTVSLV